MENNLCTKVQYTTEEFAIEDIKRIKLKSNRSRIPLRAYYCVRCNFWHLTSTKGPSDNQKLELALQEIEELKETNKQLRAEINVIKQAPSSTGDKLAIRKDLRVMELTERNKKISEEIRKLRTDNSNLIASNLQLRKKYGEV